ncbi:unnamed protein product [Chondrus crispus]|uniref:Uncharacterized protein n=1 Tax=Chondrus crispus TaxID=2769 RepID=R7QHQ4_CHOCR|nr:unnamed protein product [Chondrus crispus]CDF37609.1 unnamed protein product [Chondrus crispus]|eukprot:XP_005717480.1 unnamed protein product [Chondrus crispus]
MCYARARTAIVDGGLTEVSWHEETGGRHCKGGIARVPGVGRHAVE